jgi:integrase
MNDLATQFRVVVKPNLKLSTQLSYEWGFKGIQQTFGPLAVSEIEKAEVQAFLTGAARELAPESVYDLRNRLSGLFTAAEEWGWIRSGSNPARGKLRMPERVAVRKKQIPKPEGFQDLLMTLKQPYSTIVMLAGLSGLRKGEIEALRWNDVHAGYLEVDEAVYRRELGTPKSRRSRRRVAIGPAVQKVLEDWRKQARFQNPEDFIFALRTSSSIDLHNAVARHVKPACIELGLPPLSWHDFRHTYTTWGRKAGVKAEVMRDQLGHESVQVTLDIYSHIDDRETEARQVEEYALADYGTLNGTPSESSHAATR